jgi:hypothetical protein
MASTKKIMAHNYCIDVSGLKAQAPSFKRQAQKVSSSKLQAPRHKDQAPSRKRQAP